MSITLVNSGSFVPSAAGGQVNAATIALGWTPTNGNTLILTFGYHTNGDAVISSISQTGTTWQKAVGKNTPGDDSNGDTEIWYASDVQDAGTSLTVTPSDTNYGGAITVSEWSGLASSPVDQTAANDALGTAPVDSGTTGTTAQATELWIASFEAAAVGAENTFSSPTNGFTILGQGSQPGSGTYGSHCAAYRIVSSTGAANTQVTCSNLYASGYWEGCIATFKGAAAAAACIPWHLFFPIAGGL